MGGASRVVVSRPATVSAGISATSVPLSPKASTDGVSNAGASANPTLPPTANMPKPLPGRWAAARVARRAPPG